MRPGENNRNLIVIVELHHSRAGVIWCVVQHDDRFLSPSLVLLVHELDKVGEEELHDAAIAVGLEESGHDTTISGQSNYHRYPRLDLLLRNRIQLTNLLPLHPSEVAHTQPRLVYVDDGFLPQIDFHEGKGELLSQKDVLRVIAFPTDGFDLRVPHVQFLYHKFSEFLWLDFDFVFLLQHFP